MSSQVDSDLDHILIQTNAVQNQSLESTRRMVQLVTESEQAGIKTLDKLDEQGRQLYKIEENLDDVNQKMKAAEKNLESMEKCCGLCVLPWRKSKSFESTDGYNKTWKSHATSEIKADAPRKQQIKEETTTSSSGYIQRVTNDAREDEMDENMGHVSNMLSNLKNMGIDMGNEIERHNQVIDRITKKTEFAEVRVNVANDRTQRILKS